MAGTTQTFKWTGINSQGQRKNGVLQAADNKDAQNELKKMGVELISISVTHGLQMPAKKSKIKIKDIQLFTRYLSTMLSSGLPILQALDIIGQDQENDALKALILSIKNDVSGGKTLAETFSQHPKHFNNLYCNLIRAGEKSGTLDKLLNRLATYMEKTETLKRKIKKALTYPIAILSVAFLVSAILLLFVVPQFQNMFSSFGAKLPFFTRMIVDLSNFLKHNILYLIAGIAFIVFFMRYLLTHNETAINKAHQFSLKIMVIGNLISKGIIARFTRTLATTLEAGMPIVDSMKTMANIMGNRVYTKAVLHMCEDITNGHTLSASLSSTKLFPNMVTQMVSVGEAAGSLPEMLNKIADYYEEEVNHIVDNLSSLLEPLIMLILGVIVGTFVVAMYLPIFRMGSLF